LDYSAFHEWVGFYPSILLSFAISPVIGTPRDKPTNVLARCATQQAVGSNPARPFKHKRILFPLSSNDPTLVLALLIER
jgi:hypothetical protein